MPKQIRWTIKQELDSALNHYEKAGKILYRTEGLFREAHPELADGLKAAAVATTELYKIVEAFRNQV